MSQLYEWKGEDITEAVKKQLKAEGYRQELDIHTAPKAEDFRDFKRFRTVKGVAYTPGFVINDDRGFAAIEDFGPGEELTWDFYHDEFQYILAGEAELTYSLPPLHLERKTVRVKAGQFYIIPAGTTIHFKVLSKEPYMKLCVGMPSHIIPYPGKSKIIG